MQALGSQVRGALRHAACGTVALPFGLVTLEADEAGLSAKIDLAGGADPAGAQQVMVGQVNRFALRTGARDFDWSEG